MKRPDLNFSWRPFVNFDEWYFWIFVMIHFDISVDTRKELKFLNKKTRTKVLELKVLELTMVSSRTMCPLPYFRILFTLKFKALWLVVSTWNSTSVMKNSPISMEYLAELFFIFFPPLSRNTWAFIAYHAMNAQRATLSGNLRSGRSFCLGRRSVALQGMRHRLWAVAHFRYCDGKTRKLYNKTRSCGEQESVHFISSRRSPYLFVVAKQINVGRNVFEKGREITVVY